MKEDSVSRRDFLVRSTLAAIAITPAVNSLSQVLGIDTQKTRLLIDYGYRLTKYESLLNLEFYFINFTLKEGALCFKDKILGRYGQKECYMVVRLPQQHIAEQALSINENEPNFEMIDKFTAVTRISGYSYLVFRVMFPDGTENVKIPLMVNTLMDWNNHIKGKGYELKLVVRQNLNESLFEIQTRNLFGAVQMENHYPLGYAPPSNKIDGTVGEWNYDYNKIPKVYGDPVTAIEAPWRLILSPKLPNQDKFRFKWTFSKEPASSKNRTRVTDDNNKSKTIKVFYTTAEIWTATLSLEEDPQYAETIRIRKSRSGEIAKEKSFQADLEEEIRSMELMLLGSPDYPSPKADMDKSFKDDEAMPGFNAIYRVLPASKDRRNLVELYIKYKLLARTDKLMFSPLGITTFMELKNSLIDTTSKKKNNLYSWKHFISFGRDEEVEVVRLILDKELGHKHLLVSTTKRRTLRGVSYLDYREYVMPLDKLINYENHISEKNDAGEVVVSKFQSPFRSIEIKELKPKRIIPLAKMALDTKLKTAYLKEFDTYVYNNPRYDGTSSEPKTISNEKARLFYPVDFYTSEPVVFEYEAVDWHEQKVKFNKQIQAVELEVNNVLTAVTGNKNIEEIDAFFDGGLVSVHKGLREIENKLSGDLEATAKKEWTEFHKRYGDYLKIAEHKYIRDIKILAYKVNSGMSELKELNKTFNDLLTLFDPIKNNGWKELIGEKLERLQKKELDEIDANFKKIAKGIEDIRIVITGNPPPVLLSIVKDLDKYSREVLKAVDESEEIRKALQSTRWYDILVKADEISEELVKFQAILTSGIVSVEKLPTIALEAAKIKGLSADSIKSIINRGVLNTIEIFNQNIGFTPKNIEEGVEYVEDEISNLKTEYLLFKGNLTREAEGEAEKTAVNFFSQYASMPELQRAQAYVGALNKLVNDQVPVNFKYAKDYVNSQVEALQLEVKKNASRVYAEVTRASQDYLKGQIRKVAADMGGYINPEIPVEYITYLKDPKKLKEAIKGGLIKNIPSELIDAYDDVTGAYNNLVFISHQAKEAWKDVRQIRPADFFAGLDAKILGSIELKEILGLNFEMPRMSVVKDDRGLPVKVVYNFLTDKIKEKDLGMVRFYSKNKGKPAMFQVYMEKGIRDPKQYSSFTKLENFSVGLKPFGPEILTIFFGKLEVSSSSSKAKKTEVIIDDIKFGGPLDFVGKLAESLKIPGTGLRIKPSLKEIEIGYLYTMPSIETPSFNLANLKFDLAFTIPLPSPSAKAPKELSTIFSINKPGDKFLVSAGIFGGRGHFVLEATPKKLIGIDASIEFGGYFGINLGIAKGYVFLFAGIRYQTQTIDGEKNVLLTAYIICSGGVTVFGFISVSVTFMLSLRYNVQSNELFGTASVSYSIKIGWFTKSFTLKYSKTLKGSKGKKVDPNDDVAYIGTFYEEEVFFVSADETLLLAEEVNPPVDKDPTRDKVDFDAIYDRTAWEQYCNSFVGKK